MKAGRRQEQPKNFSAYELIRNALLIEREYNNNNNNWNS